MGTTGRPSIAQFWHPVAEATDLVNTPLAVRLLGRDLVLFRGADTRAHALKDLCVHRGAPLSRGRLVDGCLECPFHGWTYGGDGRCTVIPALEPGHPIPPAARTTSYHCEERYGLVWVALDEPVDAIPEIPFGRDEDSAFRRKLWSKLTWRTSAGRAAENTMDVAHFPFVHPMVLGDPDQPIPVTHELRAVPGGVEFTTGRAAYDEKGVPAEGSTRYRHHFPFTVHFEVNERGPAGDKITLHSAFYSPTESNVTTVWRILHRNYEPGADEPAVLEGYAQVLEQDRQILELVKPEEIPLNLRAELHLRIPDAASLAFRRWLETVNMLDLEAP
jgi:phenylpropionate dioxygenase-like ring-hydroxylating dioxygenase large terminal subunit